MQVVIVLGVSNGKPRVQVEEYVKGEGGILLKSGVIVNLQI